MARAALSAEAVVDIALRLVDEEGAGALTLAAVASRAGVATPSLYKHVRSLAELRALMSARIAAELSDRIGDAALGRSADEAVRALMLAWRDYAKERPHRYSAMLQSSQPLVEQAARRLVEILLGAMRAYGMDEARAVHAVRCLRAAVHGWAVLETQNAFQWPEELDESYELLVRMVTGGLREG